MCLILKKVSIVKPFISCDSWANVTRSKMCLDKNKCLVFRMCCPLLVPANVLLKANGFVDHGSALFFLFLITTVCSASAVLCRQIMHSSYERYN